MLWYVYKKGFACANSAILHPLSLYLPAALSISRLLKEEKKEEEEDRIHRMMERKIGINADR